MAILLRKVRIDFSFENGQVQVCDGETRDTGITLSARFTCMEWITRTYIRYRKLDCCTEERYIAHQMHQHQIMELIIASSFGASLGQSRRFSCLIRESSQPRVTVLYRLFLTFVSWLAIDPTMFLDYLVWICTYTVDRTSRIRKRIIWESKDDNSHPYMLIAFLLSICGWYLLPSRG